MSVSKKNRLKELFEEWCDEEVKLILPLAPSGSNRSYFRLQSQNHTAIGTIGINDQENNAFVAFSNHFYEKGLPVPQIYKTDLEQGIYLQEDLGATTLFSFLLQKGDGFPKRLIEVYKKVVEQLAHLQIKGGEGLDYANCYPRAAFDKQSMLWDFNTFKYYFLKFAKIPFDEQALEKDFHAFADYLLQADCTNFMFRDFQSRNIMMRKGEPFFIDYQGGRQGALQYDLASLLYQAKANMPHEIREELLQHYLSVASGLTNIDKEKFIEYYYGYVLIRSIQTFGTYGYRGLHERKEHFLTSIPFAIKNLKWIVKNVKLGIDLPALWPALVAITESDQFATFDKNTSDVSFLNVSVGSFSYKYGLPEDQSGNGGGFIFDCRCIHNPGRYEPYKKQTGRDEPVITFLQNHSNMEGFLSNIYHIVDIAVENYIERSFTNLSIQFGCTGGQHRSVYAADCLAKHLQIKYGVKVNLFHREQERKGWKN